MGNIPVGFIVSFLNGFPVGGVDQAKSGAPVFIKPVSEESYPVFALRFQILLVRIGDRMMGCPLDEMAVHEYRHKFLPDQQWLIMPTIFVVQRITL
jgi:hypothetical protein